jgi:hypothetical protein
MRGTPYGAAPDVSRHSSLLVPPPPRVTICRAATHRRPCKRSIYNGSFQLHRGRRCRPPWRFTPISLEAPASDWRLGTSWGCSTHVALAPRKPPSTGCAHTGACQHPGGPLLGHGAAVWACGPACLWTSGAGTARAGEKAHARAWWSWRGLAHTLGVRHPQTPARPKRIGGRMVFYCRAVCRRVASRASSPAQAASGPAGEAGGRSALPCVPWQPHAAAGCCGVFLPPQEAQCNPGGATSRAGLAALGAHAHP